MADETKSSDMDNGRVTISFEQRFFITFALESHLFEVNRQALVLDLRKHLLHVY